MSRRPRRQHTAEQKVALVQKHLIDKQPVSQICNENDLQPSVFYDWLRIYQANAQAVFAPPTHVSTREKQLEAENAALKARLAKKDEVVAWLAQEHAMLKKTLGET
jgi:transposase-like protein